MVQAVSHTLHVLLMNSFCMPLRDLEALLGEGAVVHVPVFSLPMGVMSLAAYARREHPEFHYTILDFNKEFHRFCQNPSRTSLTVREFIGRVLDTCDFTPDVVGVSVNFSTGHANSLLIAEVVKHYWSGVTTVFGGVHATNFSRRILQSPSVDYVIRGSAEKSFCQFLDRIQARQSPRGIAGVAQSEADIDTISEPVHTLDELPMLAYDLVEMEYYIRYDPRALLRTRATRSIPYQFSRGCCFRCTFCASHTVHGRKVLLKSTELVINELTYLKDRYQINTIIIEDDLFGFHKPSFYTLCDQLESHQLNLKFSFPNALSVAILDEPMIDRLVTIGMENAILAIESGSPYVQKHIIKKNCDLSKAIRLSRYLRKKGIPVMAYFILGFPGENIDMMKETIEFARSMELDWAYFLLAYPLPGSDMCVELLQTGVLDEETLLDILNTADFSIRAYDTPEISASDLEALAYDANIEMNFFQNYSMRSGHYERAIHKFSNVIKNYPFHIVALACRAKCYYEQGDTPSAWRDLETINTTIRTHREATRLYALYGERMARFVADIPELNPVRSVS